jgi:membrane protease YdiL (CAAX protease family)
VITNEPSPLSNQTAIEPELIPEASNVQRIVPEPKPGNAWAEILIECLKAFGTWVASVLFLLLVPLIVILPYFIYLIVNVGAPTAQTLSQDKTFILLSLIGVVPAHLLTLLLAWILTTEFGRRPFWKSLNFYWPPSLGTWKGLGLSVGFAAVLLGMGVLVTNLIGGEKTDLDKLIESSYQARLATAFLAVATAPLVEEIVYRGMLYPAAQRLLGMGWAIAIVSVLFAGVHYLQYQNNMGVFTAIVILSLALTIIRAVSKSLMIPFVVHLIFNGIQSLYLVIEPLVNKSHSTETAPAFIQGLLHLF